MKTRGVFASDSEAGGPYENGVPSFSDVASAAAWQRRVADSPDSANPGWDADCYEKLASGKFRNKRTRTIHAQLPKSSHAITTFVGWKQLCEHVLPRLDALRFASVPARSDDYVSMPGMLRKIDSTLELECIRPKSKSAVARTLKFLHDHMRCGVLVILTGGKKSPDVFAPFVNPNYENSWGKEFQIRGNDMEAYYKSKRKHYRKETIIPNVSAWWANGNVICNEAVEHLWGDSLLLPFKHLLETLLEDRLKSWLPKNESVVFFFNKRDHPQLRKDPTLEPYDFCFDEKDKKILPFSHRFSGNLSPIVSFYSNENFSDVLIPTNEEWLGGVGTILPSTTIKPLKNPTDLYSEENLAKFDKPWDSKIQTAFFRGNATGGGVTTKDNQRLRLAQLGMEWAKAERESGGRRKRAKIVPMLDAGVTGFNMRDKKLKHKPMAHADPSELKIDLAPFVEMFKQSEFKYILYVEGHCAANRYAFLMRLGVVILKVASQCEAREMWFFDDIRALDFEKFSKCENLDPNSIGNSDHIVVPTLYDQDGAELRKIIQWCRANDRACQRIAENARKFYEENLSKERMLDYWNDLVKKMARAPESLNPGCVDWKKALKFESSVFPIIQPSFDHACTQQQACLGCSERKNFNA